ncbi:MAG: hypothetical protein ABSG91_03520 [Syntrophobacteraceae bacterium]
MIHTFRGWIGRLEWSLTAVAGQIPHLQILVFLAACLVFIVFLLRDAPSADYFAARQFIADESF